MCSSWALTLYQHQDKYNTEVYLTKNANYYNSKTRLISLGVQQLHVLSLCSLSGTIESYCILMCKKCFASQAEIVNTVFFA